MNRKTLTVLTPGVSNTLGWQTKTNPAMWIVQLINEIHENLATIKSQERFMAETLFGPSEDEWTVGPNEIYIESTLLSILEYTNIIRSRMDNDIKKLNNMID